VPCNLFTQKSLSSRPRHNIPDVTLDELDIFIEMHSEKCQKTVQALRVGYVLCVYRALEGHWHRQPYAKRRTSTANPAQASPIDRMTDMEQTIKHSSRSKYHQFLNCRRVGRVKPPLYCFLNPFNTLSNYVLGVSYILYT